MLKLWRVIKALRVHQSILCNSKLAWPLRRQVMSGLCLTRLSQGKCSSLPDGRSRNSEWIRVSRFCRDALCPLSGSYLAEIIQIGASFVPARVFCDCMCLDTRGFDLFCQAGDWWFFIWLSARETFWDWDYNSCSLREFQIMTVDRFPPGFLWHGEYISSVWSFMSTTDGKNMPRQLEAQT